MTKENFQVKKRKIIIHKCNSYEEAEEFAIEYEISLSPEERLDILQSLREDEFLYKNESRRRLRTIHKAIKQKQS